jgi:hypothetical protein
MAAHQVAMPKRKRDSTDLKITLPACPAAPAPFEAVQSDFADSADEMAVDPLSSESEDTLFPLLSVLLENPPAKAAKNPHKPKKAKKSSNRRGDKDVNSDGLETWTGNLTASDDLALPVKKSHKHAKARPPVEVPKLEDLSEHILN